MKNFAKLKNKINNNNSLINDNLSSRGRIILIKDSYVQKLNNNNLIILFIGMTKVQILHMDQIQEILLEEQIDFLHFAGLEIPNFLVVDNFLLV